MASVVQICSSWLDRHAPWRGNRLSPGEGFGAALLLAAALALAWFGGRWSLTTQVVLWAMLAVALAVLLRRGWVKLFGPVVFYDLLRIGRRSRYILYRTLYALFLLLILTWVYFAWTERGGRGYGVPAHQMARFNESFFFTFMAVQFALVLILTPAFVAGAIAEEKDRMTLEFLLATDLRNREIVLGKLVSRLASMLCIVLAGVPVLSATQFLGGVDPELLLASFAVVGLTLVTVASLSIMCSLAARRPRDAVILAYMAIVLYPVAASAARGLLVFFGYWLAEEWGIDWAGTAIQEGLSGAVQAFGAGDPFWLIGLLIQTLNSGGTLDAVLPDAVRDYALFHVVVSLLLVTCAIARLRTVALKEAHVKQRRGSWLPSVWARPAVGATPMMWKEIYAEPGLRFGRLGGAGIGALVIASFVPAFIILIEDRRGFIDGMNIWVRTVGTSVACLLLIAVAVRAAGSVSSERDRQTIDGLLTTPLEVNAILSAKWLGSILSVRLGWLWLGGIWMLGVLSGSLHPLAVPLLVVSWGIFAALFAWLGIWFSVVSRTSLRATLWTLLTALFIGGGHWIVLGMCCFMPLGCLGGLGGLGGGDTGIMDAVLFFAGQTPPATLGLLAFSGNDFRHIHRYEGEWIFFAFVGLVTWGGAAAYLSWLTCERFTILTCRRIERHQSLAFGPPGAMKQPPSAAPPWPPSPGSGDD